MLIKKRRFLEIILPLTMLAFIGQGCYAIHSVISLNTRWIFLLVLFVYTLSRRRLLVRWPADVRLALLMYVGWCFLTIFWSEEPILSCAKIGCLLCVLLTCIESGLEWVLTKGWENSLTCFFLLCVVFLLLDIRGINAINALRVLDTHLMYKGETGNSNYLGFLQALIFPFVLWKCYRYWLYPVKRLLWCFLLVLTLGFLISAFSRSAILMVFFTSMFFIAGFNVKKAMRIFFVCVLIMLLAACFFSESLQSYMYKGHAESLVGSRRTVWDASRDAAYQGGWMGAGYGVTIDGGKFDFKKLAGTYGREKGSSPLAVLEETGKIGMVFYLFFWVTLLHRLLRYYCRLQGDEKLMCGLILGSILGLLMHSIVEAWWVAPAAPESISFWMFCGISMGYMHIMKERLRRGNVSNVNK